MAERILMNEFKTLSQEKWVHIELHNEDIFKWNVALIVLNPDSLYYGGYFKATMTFPKNYPYAPPEFRFVRSIYHPNIYHNGTVCISILHAPGEDEMSGELPAERWSPAQRVESVLISILSLLDDAEVSSPANVDAAVTLRKDFETYKAIVRETVEASKSDIPEDFIMPTHESSMTKPAVVEKDDPDFWAESDDDDEESFGGSDSDMQFDDTQDVDLDEMYYTDSNDDDDDDDVSFQEIEDIEEYKKKMRAQKEEKAKEKAKARAREQEQEQAEAEALAQN